MSVINNVLKDLEARKSRFTPIELSSAPAPKKTPRDRRQYYALASLPLLLTIGLIFYLLQFGPDVAVESLSGTKTVTMPIQPRAAAIPDAKSSAAPAMAETVVQNQILGLQIRESETEMQMEFALRGKVVAFLKQRGENSFSYHLRDIESRIAAPQMRDNPWVRSLDIVPLEKGVDVTFATAADILVETRQVLADGEAVWSINLRQATAASGAAEIAQPLASETDATREPAIATADAPGPDVAEAGITQPAVAEAGYESPAASTAAAEVRLDIKPTSPAAKTINQMEYAVELINSRRFADAENLLLGLLGSAEDRAVRQHLLALYQHQNRDDRFASLARESMTQYPEDAMFATEYARQLFQQGAYRAATSLFAERPTLDADQHALMGASYQRMDEHDAAVRHYRRALEQDATNAKNWIGLGISLEHLAKLEDALNSYRRAEQLGRLNARLQAFVEKRSNTLAQVLN